MSTGAPATPLPRHGRTDAPSARVGGPAPCAEPAWRALSPLTAWAGAVALAVVLGLPALIATAVIALLDGLPPWAAVIVPATALLVAGLVGIDLLRLRLTRYRVTGQRVEMYTGILARSYRSIPRERIRSVDVNAPVWARPFGLCGVVVGTGRNVDATGADELRLDYVIAAEGERLRRELLVHAAGRGGSRSPESTGDSGEHGAAAPAELARLTPVWLGYAALTWYTVALGAAALGGVLGGLGWIGPERAGSFPLLPVEAAHEIYAFLLARLILAIPAALLFVLVTGAVAAVALQLEAWWGYRLSREPGGTLRLRRGLLNLASLSLEERRLRGVAVSEPLPLRWFGAAAVSAVATGLADREGAAVAKSSLTPEMPRAEALRVAGAVLAEAGSPTDVPLTAHPRAALRRRLNRAAAATGALSVSAAVAGTLLDRLPLWGVAVVALGSAALLAPYAVGCYRGLGHAVGRRYLVVRTGMLARTTVALRREAVIGWTVSRSPFQRRLGLATVRATTAAGDGVYCAPDVGLGEGLAFADAAVPDLLTPFLERA
ncbi:putative membrane protein [Nocardiopsis mwathae]|uniref:Putative membrane protein n=1 Tax=Nocardiopsis mwathae TaxID=1472723 RepID=A0A7X0D4N6_9ACTN|nr:PH domain-containing protein [Nocardiopsis mwathae]MBB6171497.1 putative membrane protein [Nocardiopsis mwathae]